MFFLTVTFPSSADVCCLKKKKKKIYYAIGLATVFMHEGCDRISVQECVSLCVCVCVSLCVCVCVCVCLALARALAERRARWKGHLLRQPTHLVSDFCTHINASRRRRTYMYDCTNAHRCTETLHQKGQRGGVENQSWVQMKTYARIIETNQQTTPRHVEARAHGLCTRAHTHTHTHTPLSSEQMKHEGMMRTAEEHSVFSEPCWAVASAIRAKY